MFGWICSFFQNNIRHTVKYCVWYSKHFKAFLIHHTSPIKFMYIHWVFPLENGGSDRYLCIYKYIYIIYCNQRITHEYISLRRSFPRLGFLSQCCRCYVTQKQQVLSHHSTARRERKGAGPNDVWGWEP